MKLGNLVRQIRKEKSFTMQRLADEAGICRTYISKIESGKVENPSLDITMRITKILDNYDLLTKFIEDKARRYGLETDFLY